MRALTYTLGGPGTFAPCSAPLPTDADDLVPVLLLHNTHDVTSACGAPPHLHTHTTRSLCGPRQGRDRQGPTCAAAACRGGPRTLSATSGAHPEAVAHTQASGDARQALSRTLARTCCPSCAVLKCAPTHSPGTCILANGKHVRSRTLGGSHTHAPVSGEQRQQHTTRQPTSLREAREQGGKRRK
jgi:hypothetical protein